MTLWKLLLVLSVSAAIAAAIGRLRRGARIDRSEGNTQPMAERSRREGGVRVPLFAGDRYGDDWGRA